MGGEITYSCVGSNQFVFELVFYRDCNGAEVNIVSENLRVWNHPSVQNINLLYVSREDISPFCTSVVGGPVPLECGIGSADSPLKSNVLFIVQKYFISYLFIIRLQNQLHHQT